MCLACATDFHVLGNLVGKKRPLSRQELSTSPRGSEHNDGGHLLPLVIWYVILGHPSGGMNSWKVRLHSLRHWNSLNLFSVTYCWRKKRFCETNLIPCDQGRIHILKQVVGAFDSQRIKSRHVKPCYPEECAAYHLVEELLPLMCSNC